MQYGAHDFGVEYRSSAILVGGRLAGRRAPHAWVLVQDRLVSTLDLFGDRLTVLTGPEGQRWRNGADALAAAGTPIVCYSVSRDFEDPEEEFAKAYGLGRQGAVLVRPDGYAAWDSTNPAGLTEAVTTILGMRQLIS